jgi:hypothetical protein
MKNSLNRRAMFLSAAGAAALAIPALSRATALAASPDAHILELFEEIKTKNAKLVELYAKGKLTYKAATANYPPMPSVMRGTPQDLAFGFPKAGDWHTADYYTTFHLNELKQLKCQSRVNIPVSEFCDPAFTKAEATVLFAGASTVTIPAPWPEAEARRNELIGAITKWSAKCRKADKLYGDYALSLTTEKLEDEKSELFDEMAQMQARSLQGILAKARVVKMIHQDDPQIEIGEANDAELASSLIMDMLALVENGQNEMTQLKGKFTC